MYTSEINRALSYLDCYVGTFARDTIPNRITQFPCALIVNTDPESEPGEHWVAIFIDDNGNGEYFDSFGLPPLHASIKTFLERNTRTLCFNTVTLQAITAITCGEYCVLYIKLRCFGYSIGHVLALFTNSTVINDLIVSDIFNAIR